ncbi:hypothetical protein IFM89_003849 [Coptis chinensis]|uniref:EF-hand domain-containing protein n=1 Tax=Coptis chinensis TaxID=261450 RepID=A0A835IU54_9MAGN|nr:hypothetical protein IFM89_003849 [Coptis chinensis]
MYSRGSNNSYGQQAYAGQQAYGQSSAAGYSGTSIGESQLSLPSRHSSMLATSQDTDIGSYRASNAQYGGQYGSVYGSGTLSSAQQAASAMSSKVAGSSSLQGRALYASTVPESSNFASGDYVSSLERRNYADHQSAYIGRDLQSEPSRRYTDSVGLGSQHQASLLRQQQLLKSQSLQSVSLDGSARQGDYLAARGAAIRHTNQDLTSYGGRIDADPRNLSMISGGSYAQHQASILGAVPRRNVEDLMYAQGSSTAGYGVSLPPGRDYAAGKGLRGTSRENDYRGGHPSVGGSRIDERKEDRGGFRRELDKRDEERRREHLREREKEREREKDRERERERKRERERRDKERERERKRMPDIRRELTPPRISRDLHGSSLLKEDKSLRRDSPRRDVLHRRHSPVREKRREYICKVYPSSLVEVERDYLSLSKRYPNLSISPEFSKAWRSVVLNWPKDNLKLSFHTPVSFEHDVSELEMRVEPEGPSSKPSSEESGPTKNVVWNAKVILMSGISKNSHEELSSEKTFDDRIPHINNILRFAFLRKDRSLIAIGGPWDAVDGGDPSVDDSSLLQTALRHAKDLVRLDLRSCQQWNRFLEIHYDRVGKDGLFSHKEITVLFIPDLSECLPSLSEWRDQWVAHRKSVIEKERLISLKTEKSVEKNTAVKGEQSNTKADKVESLKDVKVEGKHVKMEKEPHGKSSDQTVDSKKTVKERGNEIQDNGSEKQMIKDEIERSVDEKDAVGKEASESIPHVTEAQKPGKRKIMKKVLKQKVVDKKSGGEDSVSKDNKQDKTDAGEKQGQAESNVQQTEASVEPPSAKTFVRKKIVKKVPAGKSAKKASNAVQSEDIQTEGKPEDQEDKVKDKSDTTTAVIPEGGMKTTTKKKVIKRVPKKKVTDIESKGEQADSKNSLVKDGNGCEIEKTKEQSGDTGTPVLDVKKTAKKESPGTESKVMKVEKQDDGTNKSGGTKDVKGKGADGKKDSETKLETEAAKGKGSNKDSHDGKKERTNDEKDNKDKKDESKYRSSKDARDKGKSDELPHHPGFILQTKRTKESKIRSMSLSLDSLLDYNDKDIEESTFELSLFAESMYELLQYQMGCRLLSFLQNIRISFVNKRNQRKRQREENPKKEIEKEDSPRKRLKTNEELLEGNESAKAELPDTANKNQEDAMTKDDSDPDEDDDDDSKMGNETDDYDPEEEVDEDQEMDDASNEGDASNEAWLLCFVLVALIFNILHFPDCTLNQRILGVILLDPKSQVLVLVNLAGNDDKVTGEEATSEKETTDQKNTTEVITEAKESSNVEEANNKAAEVEVKDEPKSSVKDLTVDKELLQAFRFFDRNRVGYIKVEDMRVILHNLGKFISHRDVKELVQSALLESNTARDNRILYNKLVRS